MDSNTRRRPGNTAQYHDHEDEVTVLTGLKTSTIGSNAHYTIHLKKAIRKSI